MTEVYIHSTITEIDKLVAELDVHVFYLRNLSWWERRFKRDVLKQAIISVCQSIQRIDLLISSTGDRATHIETLRVNENITPEIKEFLLDVLERQESQFLVDQSMILRLIDKHSTLRTALYFNRVAY